MENNKAMLEAISALVKVQAELRPVVRNAENPFFKSSYADLCQVWVHCVYLLNRNGFAVSQPTRFVGDKFVLTTNLMHSGGHIFSGDYWVNPKDLTDPQKMGSCVSYAKRYGLAALVGVVTDSEDDDGNKASEPSRHTEKSANETKSTGSERFGVQSVKEEPFTSKAGKSFTRFKIISDSGQSYSTIIKKTADEANRARREGKQVDLTFKEDSFGLSILDIKVVEEVAEEVEF